MRIWNHAPGEMLETTGIHNIFLLEDHVSFRQSLALMLESEDCFRVVGQAGSIAEATKAIGELKERVDLAILDLNLPDGEGTDLVEVLRGGNPEFAALVLTASFDRSEHARAVEAGASGILHKTADLDEITDSMKSLAAGRTLMSAEEISEMVRLADECRMRERDTEEKFERLTKRERQVLSELAKGMSNREIAETLRISVDTERTHMVNILNKLGAHSRLQALVLAARNGLVTIERA